MSKLAIKGGKKVRTDLFRRYNNIGIEEKNAVNRVMDKGVLSKYLGSCSEDFYGGEEVKAFEKEWSDYYNAKHTVAVNSNSSGLHVALGACGIGYGDEVIVSPYSMSVSASAPLVWNATPVFADIDNNHYCITPNEFKNKITNKTKAIIIVHIFGCPADMDEIVQIARENDIFIIEDCAQAPGSVYKGRKVGTLGDIGVFSLNYHKHIHTGEGGMCTTNNENLAKRMQLIRNHAEAVVDGMGEEDLINMLGFNMRLTEIQAAIGREQLKKLCNEVEYRRKVASIYNEVFSQFKFIETTEVNDRIHSYYVQAFQFDSDEAGVSRERFIEAVKAELMPVEGREGEGIPIYGGYTKPLYLLSIFQQKIVYKDGFPFNGDENYSKGICPVVEDMHFNKLWYHDFTRSPLDAKDVQDVAQAYLKVLENINELQ